MCVDSIDAYVPDALLGAAVRVSSLPILCVGEVASAQVIYEQE